jgi:MraZ protein
MFSGRFQHTLDNKNRIAIPSKFREFIRGDEHPKGFFISICATGVERCLYLYTSSGWKKFIAQVYDLVGKSAQGENFLRALAAYSEFVSLDAQSRIVIPQHLIDFAGLKREVMLVGAINRIEIWNLEDWKKQGEALYQDLSQLQREFPKEQFKLEL